MKTKQNLEVIGLKESLLLIHKIPLSSEVRIVTITPRLAQEWIGRNVHNRVPNKRGIERYAEDIKTGRWRLTGESIKFDNRGVLVDGQNRLYAVIKAGIQMESYVCFGLDPDSFINLDTGRSRRLSDVLHLRGEAQANLLASSLLFVDSFTKKYYGELGLSRTSREQAVHLLESEHSAIRDSMPFGTILKGIMIPSVAVALHYLCACINKDKADDFFTGLAKGEAHHTSSPILLVRRKLLKMMEGGLHRLGRYGYMERCALVIKGWNAFIKDEYPERIEWINYGPEAEPFPDLLTPKSSIPEEVTEKICQLYQSRMGIKAIAKEINVARSNVRRTLIRAGIYEGQTRKMAFPNPTNSGHANIEEEVEHINGEPANN